MTRRPTNIRIRININIKILRSSKPCMYAFEFENQDGTMLKDQLRNSIQKIFSQMETEAWVE